eukprot:g3516.t1
MMHKDNNDENEDQKKADMTGGEGETSNASPASSVAGATVSSSASGNGGTSKEDREKGGNENLMLPLNSKQKHLVTKLRNQLPSIANRGPALGDDVRFWRYVRGHKYVEEKALEVIKATMHWRAHIEADRILNVIRKDKLKSHEFPYVEHGKKLFPVLALPDDACAKDGSPLWFLQFGRVTAAPLSSGDVTLDELEEYLCYQYEERFENLRRISQKTRFLRRYYIVVDLEGLGMAHTSSDARQTFRKVAGILSSNYCESSCRIVIVNAPLIFRTIWAVIKPWLPERTIKKISIHGGDYAESLLRDVDEKYVPVAYGGKLKLAASPAAKTVSVDPKFKRTVTIAAGAADKTVALVVKAGDRVRWRVFVDYGRDVDVAVRFSPSAEGRKSAILAKRDGAVSASGFCYAPEDGSAVLFLDNARAWVNSKTVHAQFYVEAQ